MLERADLLNGHSDFVHMVKSRAKGIGEGGKIELAHAIKRVRKCASLRIDCFFFFNTIEKHTIEKG